MFMRLGTPSGLRMMSTGRAVRQERHVLRRQDLGDDALVAVAAGHLVADGDLALLGDGDADQPVDAGQELVVQLAAELANVDDLAALAVGQAQRAVLHLARLLAEDRAEQSLLRRQLGLALGRDLADEDVAGPDLGADVDDAVLVEVLEGLLADVRDVARDLLGAELGVTRLDLVLLDVDAREQVVADEAVADDDRVLVVAALPAHERDEDVPAERQLAVARDELSRRWPRLALTRWPTSTMGRWLMHVPWLVRTNFWRRYSSSSPAVGLDPDPLGGHAGDDAAALRDDDLAGVARGALLHPGADDRRLRLEERHGLALHVRAHEGAVGVVVLEERDERGRHGDDLLGAHVHVLDLVRRAPRGTVAVARRDALVDEVALVVERRVGLRDDVLLLLVGREVLDLVGHDRADRERVEPSASSAPPRRRR